MRVEIKKEKKIISKYVDVEELVDVRVYIADDGKEFSEERRCLWYEMHKREKECLEGIEVIHGENLFPDHKYIGFLTWYRVKSLNELNLLIEGLEMQLNKPYNGVVGKNTIKCDKARINSEIYENGSSILTTTVLDYIGDQYESNKFAIIQASKLKSDLESIINKFQ